MTRTFLVLFVAMTIITVGALVWLPAVFGFSAAVGLASFWCWLLDRRPGPPRTVLVKANI